MREMKVVVTNYRVIRADENLIFHRNLTMRNVYKTFLFSTKYRIKNEITVLISINAFLCISMLKFCNSV